MSTKLQEMSPTGMFARAKDSEPLFLLMARDPSAPALIEAWAKTREAEVTAGRRPAGDLVQVREARQCAEEMRAWRDANDGMWRDGMFADDKTGLVPPELLPETVLPQTRRRPE